MSVILEFTIADDAFRLGEVLGAPSGMHLELERIVPTGSQVMPFVWATGDDHAAFERQGREHPQVREMLTLDRVGDRGRYRIEWEDPPSDLLATLAETDATVLEAEGEDVWRFRLRFPDHSYLTEFHNLCTERGLPIHVERTYTFSEEADQRHQYGLSRAQRTALVLALEEGYFETPSQVTLAELAEELSISRQALSKRIRRGNERILNTALLSSVADAR